MSSPTLDDQEFDFGERFTGTRSDTVSHKRSSAEFDDGNFDNDPYGKKAKTTAEVEAASGVATGMILSLRESLQDCKETLDSCLNELEDAQYEIQNWRSAFQNAPFIPAGTTPVPKLVINYLQALKSSVESLADQLEKAKKKEVAFIVTFAKREQEIAKLKSAVRDLKAQLKPASMQARRFLLDPVIHEEFMRLKVSYSSYVLTLNQFCLFGMKYGKCLNSGCTSKMLVHVVIIVLSTQRYSEETYCYPLMLTI